MKEIREELHYDQPAGAVLELIASGAFQLELLEHIGGHDLELVEEATTPQGGRKVVTRQRSGVDMPGFVKKLVPDSTVTQTYEWEPPQPDGSVRGTWAAEIKGAPIAIGGPTELRPDGAGCVHVYGGSVRASVPVVGGRLESFALDNLRRELSRTREFTSARLQG